MRTVWITGGGTGIGRALAERCYERGDRVVISGRRADVLAQTARAIAGAEPGHRFFTFAGDASDADHMNTVVDRLASHGIFVDVLINNAGHSTHRTFDEAEAAEFMDAFRINCMSSVQGIKAVLPAMRERRAGAIVIVSSVLGQWGSCGAASYSISKYGATGIIDVMRQELVGTGIHILGVYPGFVRTALTSPLVKPGSFKDRNGITPHQMADAILRALHRRKTELYYPWYVPWLIRLHRAAPQFAARLSRRYYHKR